MGRIAQKNRVGITRNDSRANCYKISSSNEMFENEYLIVKIHEDYISISVPSIDYQGKSYSTSRSNKNRCNDNRGLGISSIIDIAGSYLIDEEYSTEDELIINF